MTDQYDTASDHVLMDHYITDEADIDEIMDRIRETVESSIEKEGLVGIRVGYFQ